MGTIALFPLQNVTEADLQELCETLWRWKRCDICISGQSCGSNTCPWKRWKRLTPFFQFYKSCTALHVPDLLSDNDPALNGHDDLRNIIDLLRDKSSSPRASLMEEHFSSRSGSSQPEDGDKHRAFDLALKVMSMVSCTGEDQPADLLDAGSEPVEWRNGESLQQFFTSAFPTRDHPTLNEKDEAGVDIKSLLNAAQLQKIAGLKFRGTDNLRDHLRMDQDTGVVEFYHHTSVLKEHLRNPQSIIPRKLALETLDSLQTVVFPTDRESRRILRSLVAKENLDPDCLRFERIDRDDEEKNIKYQYWASRLMDLYDEVENPKARGLLQLWMERKSGARYVMMATLAGVVIAVVLGLLGLGVGIFQAWVGYQQWQHPISTS